MEGAAALAGDHWSQVVDELILADIESAIEQAESGDVQLSVHLQMAKDLIYNPELGFIPTSSVVSRLIKFNPDQWSSSSYYGKDLTPQRLGRILSGAFGVNSQRVGDSARGYHANQFKAIWRQLGVTTAEPTEATEPTEPTGGETF
jgi:hypothetical protein